MNDFWKAFFEELGNILPFISILILGAFFWITGSTGVFIGGGKIDEKVKKPLSFLGLILTVVGLITTITSISFLFWDFLIPYQLNLYNLWKWFLNLFTWLNLLVAGVLGLILYIAYCAIQKRIEKEYKLKVVEVIIYDDVAALQVENIGKGKFSCIARLANISTLKGREKLDVFAVNPKGLFLRWDDERGIALLEEKIPRTINLVRILDNYSPATVNFMFSNRTYSNPLPDGEYLLEICLFRMNRGQQIKMAAIEKKLNIKNHHDPKINWIA